MEKVNLQGLHILAKVVLRTPETLPHQRQEEIEKMFLEDFHSRQYSLLLVGTSEMG